MAPKLVWVGPRESDTLYSGVKFAQSITFNGTNQDGNTAFTSQIKTRIDHISDGSKWHLNHYIQENLEPLLADPNIRFMFYNSLLSYRMGNKVLEQTLCANSLELLRFFQSKANMRAFAEEIIPVVPYVHFFGKKLPSVKFDAFAGSTYVLQKVFSSAGAGTHSFSQEACKQYIADGQDQEEYILSPYIQDSAPINVHMVIFEESCVVLPPSFQLISHQGSMFSYIGGDFHTNLSTEQYALVLQRATALGEKMRLLGYRGVCGVDFLLTKDELYFLEINARFQSSSFLLNKLLLKDGKPSLIQMNLMAFSKEKPPVESFMSFPKAESFFNINGDHCPDWVKKSPKEAPNNFECILDGLSEDMVLTPQAYLCRVVTEKPLCWLCSDHYLRLAPNIQRDEPGWRDSIRNKDPLSLKIGLLTQGVRFSSIATEEMKRQGNVRAGVFQSVDLTFPNGLTINSPYHTVFSALSPYQVEWDHHGFYLSYEGTPLSLVSLASEDPYRNCSASNGTLFRNAAFLATDRLRVHHELRCRFKEEGHGCLFCNARLKSGSFSIDDVYEVIDFYLEHIPFRHFLIGGGSGTDEDEPKHILALARYIKSKSDKPIYAMCLPPKDLSILEEYYKAGITEIGFNLELFDRVEAAKIMPGKGTIPLSRYENAYRESVRLWGKEGAVRSLLVLGLEPLESFYAGVEWLCNLGVMPIVSVFRPMENIALSHALPPGNQELANIFRRGTRIANAYGLALGPSCKECQNNTLSLPL